MVAGYGLLSTFHQDLLLFLLPGQCKAGHAWGGVPSIAVEAGSLSGILWPQIIVTCSAATRIENSEK